MGASDNVLIPHPACPIRSHWEMEVIAIFGFLHPLMKKLSLNRDAMIAMIALKTESTLYSIQY